MKVTKSAVYRITASAGCACTVTREFEDTEFKSPLGEATFVVCKKHDKQPGVDIVEMILTELVDKEATDHVSAPPPASVSVTRPNAAAVVNENGELEMRVPIQTRPTPRTMVKPSGSTVPATGRPVNAAQAGRTGPAKAYARPTAPVRPATGLATALTADDGPEEDDIFSANDPDLQNAR